MAVAVAMGGVRACTFGGKRGLYTWARPSLDDPHLDVRVEADTEERVDLLHAQGEALEP